MSSAGKRVEEFEKKIKRYTKAKFAVAVVNGTQAIYISLKACGIGQGDEVITVSNTAVPTVTAIVNAGAIARFVDIDKYSLIDVTKIEQAITKKTKAIIPVHLFGQTCEMNKIMELAKKHK